MEEAGWDARVKNDYGFKIHCMVISRSCQHLLNEHLNGLFQWCEVMAYSVNDLTPKIEDYVFEKFSGLDNIGMWSTP